MRRRVRVLRQGFLTPPERDTAVSHALLRRVAAGAEPESFRLHRPAAVVAFGPKDRLSPGFGRAVREARALGFEAVLRLAGGRAAVFHEGTLAFSWAVPDPEPRARIRERFEEAAGLVAEALRSLGVDARVGEVPGEYCPGEHSVNARGSTKLVGVGQRLVAGAAHVGGVVVVRGSERVREVLVPVYRALSLPWDPATAGAVEDEVPGLSEEDVARAILDRLAARCELDEGEVSEETLALADALAPRHAVAA